MQKRLAIAIVVFAASASAGAPQSEAPQSVDVTSEVVALMQCTTTSYESHRDPAKTFDESAHERAWTDCEPARRAILDKLPADQRAAWEDRLATIHRSVAESFSTPEGVSGYGLNPKKPVMIGAGESGVKRARDYFSRLRGPAGEPIQIRRLGSCCRFPTPKAEVGNSAVLDEYEVTYAGQREPAIIFVNSYEEGPLEVVPGFTLTDATP